MPSHQVNIVTCIIVAAHLALVIWVVRRRRGIRPILAANLVIAGGILWSVASSLPSEIAFAWSDPDSGWFDWKYTIVTAFETAVVLASLVAFFGRRAAKIIAWLGFAGNLALMVFVLTLKFEFKCCGYL